MTGENIILVSMLMIMLTACASPEPARHAGIVVYDHRLQPLYRPATSMTGRLNYAGDHSSFAPVLTHRVAYPTQAQANAAYGRLFMETARDRNNPASIRLFACTPGAVDPETARVISSSGPVVHCATDFLDAQGQVLQRDVVNFHYSQRRWHALPVDPPRAIAPWHERQRSPRDPWGWLPGRSRYQ